MNLSDFIFYFLSFITLFSSLLVICVRNPIYSALSMAGTMIGVAFLFFSLKAYFIGGVQLVVYAGAVMVLFVMVLMIFDLKEEKNTHTKGLFLNITKFCTLGFFIGFLSAVLFMSSDLFKTSPSFTEAKKQRLLRLQTLHVKNQSIHKKTGSLKANGIPEGVEEDIEQDEQDAFMSTKLLSQKLFKNYFFAFELLGIFLLAIAVGVVVISFKTKDENEEEKNAHLLS